MESQTRACQIYTRKNIIFQFTNGSDAWSERGRGEAEDRSRVPRRTRRMRLADEGCILLGSPILFCK